MSTLPTPASAAPGLFRDGWAWVRATARQLLLAGIAICLPLQGLATAVGTIDGVAHVHRAPPAAPGPQAPASEAVSAVPLPPGLPVLLSVDDLRHSHGAPLRRARDEAGAAAHHHAGVAHHTHAADDTSVVAVADPADDGAASGGSKRLLLDVDTPPVRAPALAHAPGGWRPASATAAGGPGRGPERLDRPPRTPVA